MKHKPIFRTVERSARIVRQLRRALLFAACLVTPLAHADIYGYVDSNGDTHFSTEQIDARYQLFIRGDRSFDTSELTASAPTPLHPSLFKALTQHPNLKKYEALLTAAAKEFKVDVALMKAMMAAESGFNPTAVSPKGAIGLMQIMPATAERYGIEGNAKISIQQKLTDPKTNLRLAARYLRDLNQLFPNQQPLVIASYNAGEGAVQKYRNQVPPYPETRNYVQLVTQFYQFYLPPDVRRMVQNEQSGNSAHRIHLTIPGRANMPSPIANTTTSIN